MNNILNLLSHACFLVDDGDSKLLTDPWFFGQVFNCGWKLEREINPLMLNLKDVTHVHITHEHPDHFHIPTLKLLNDHWDPIFLLQSTSDERMAKFIKNSLRKRVIQLRDGQVYCTSGQTSIKIFSHGHMDSFSLINIGDYTILNLNDCVLKSKKSLFKVAQRLKTTSVDILMSQYSFASYQGNKEEDRLISRAAAQHIEWIKMRNEYFRPKVFVPFASGVIWTHEENKYLNDYRVDYQTALDALESCKHKSIVLGKNPGSVITDLTQLRITRSSIMDDNLDMKGKVKYLDQKTIPVTKPDILLDSLLSAMQSARKRLLKTNHRSILRAINILYRIGFLKDVVIQVDISSGKKIYVIIQKCLSLSELHYDKNPKVTPHIAMSYDSLMFCLENDFGAETLWINSRFSILRGHPKDFFKHFYPFILSNQGFFFPLGYIRFALRRMLLPNLISD